MYGYDFGEGTYGSLSDQGQRMFNALSSSGRSSNTASPYKSSSSEDRYRRDNGLVTDDAELIAQYERASSVTGGLNEKVGQLNPMLQDIQNAVSSGAAPSVVRAKKQAVMDRFSEIRQAPGYRWYLQLDNAGDEGRRISYMLRSLDNGTIWGDSSVLERSLYGITPEQWKDVYGGSARPGGPMVSRVPSVDGYLVEDSDAAKENRRSVAQAYGLSNRWQEYYANDPRGGLYINQLFHDLDAVKNSANTATANGIYNYRDRASIAKEASANQATTIADIMFYGKVMDEKFPSGTPDHEFDDFVKAYMTNDKTRGERDERALLAGWEDYNAMRGDMSGPYGSGSAAGYWARISSQNQAIVSRSEAKSTGSPVNIPDEYKTAGNRLLSSADISAIRARTVELARENGIRMGFSDIDDGTAAFASIQKLANDLNMLSSAGIDRSAFSSDRTNLNDIYANFVLWSVEGSSPNSPFLTKELQSMIAAFKYAKDVIRTLPEAYRTPAVSGADIGGTPGRKTPAGDDTDNEDTYQSRLRGKLSPLITQMSAAAFEQAAEDGGKITNVDGLKEKLTTRLKKTVSDEVKPVFGLEDSQVTSLVEALVENEMTRIRGTGDGKVRTFMEILHDLGKAPTVGDRPAEPFVSATAADLEQKVKNGSITPDQATQRARQIAAAYDSFSDDGKSVVFTKFLSSQENLKKVSPVLSLIAVQPETFAVAGASNEELECLRRVATGMKSLYDLGDKYRMGYYGHKAISAVQIPAMQALFLRMRDEGLKSGALETFLRGGGDRFAGYVGQATEKRAEFFYRKMNGIARCDNHAERNANDSNVFRNFLWGIPIHNYFNDVNVLLGGMIIDAGNAGTEEEKYKILSTARDIMFAHAPSFEAGRDYRLSGQKEFMKNAKMLDDAFPAAGAVRVLDVCRAKFGYRFWSDVGFQDARKFAFNAIRESDEVFARSNIGISLNYKGSPLRQIGALKCLDDGLNTDGEEYKGCSYFEPTQILAYENARRTEQFNDSIKKFEIVHDKDPDRSKFRSMENAYGQGSPDMERLRAVAEREAVSTYGTLQNPQAQKSINDLMTKGQDMSPSERREFIDQLENSRIVYIPMRKNAEIDWKGTIVKPGQNVLSGKDLISLKSDEITVVPQRVSAESADAYLNQVYFGSGLPTEEHQSLLMDMYFKELEFEDRRRLYRTQQNIKDGTDETDGIVPSS